MNTKLQSKARAAIAESMAAVNSLQIAQKRNGSLSEEETALANYISQMLQQMTYKIQIVVEKETEHQEEAWKAAKREMNKWSVNKQSHDKF